MQEYIATLTKTKEIMNKYGTYFKKKFGQNFLVEKNVIEKIIENANVTNEDTVIEIGPGIGNMTQYLATYAKKVVAIEIDRDFALILKNDTLSTFDNVDVISDDILKVDLEEFFKKYAKDRKVKFVSNLPYYITTPIIMELLKYREHIESITIMIQKEVAERIDAKPKTKDYGALTIAIKVFADSKYVMTVSKNCFIPEPNVDSAVIKLDILDKPNIDMENTDLYFKVVKAAFSQRRKTLVNTLYGSFDKLNSKEEIENMLTKLNLNPKVRGEELSISEFEDIAKEIEKLK